MLAAAFSGSCSHLGVSRPPRGRGRHCRSPDPRARGVPRTCRATLAVGRRTFPRPNGDSASRQGGCDFHTTRDESARERVLFGLTHRGGSFICFVESRIFMASSVVMQGTVWLWERRKGRPGNARRLTENTSRRGDFGTTTNLSIYHTIYSGSMQRLGFQKRNLEVAFSGVYSVSPEATGHFIARASSGRLQAKAPRNAALGPNDAACATHARRVAADRTFLMFPPPRREVLGAWLRSARKSAGMTRRLHSVGMMTGVAVTHTANPDPHTRTNEGWCTV